MVYKCELVHPPTRWLKCWNAERGCHNADCKFLHPAGHKVCPLSVSCVRLDCDALHPPGRAKACERGVGCWVEECDRLHPEEWSVCVEGIACRLPRCTSAHPPNHAIAAAGPARAVRGPGLKTAQQRAEDRLKAGLPILASKYRFI